MTERDEQQSGGSAGASAGSGSAGSGSGDGGGIGTSKQSIWGKPPTASERQEHSERRHSILSNLLTLAFSGIIIAGGFLLPTFLYPYLDFYSDETVHLTRPSESTLAEHVFDEPVTLYPWNIYENGGGSLRSLSSAERDLLNTQGIPDFLVATLRDHGLQTDSDEDAYRTQIINAFRYLEPDDAGEPGCFILGDTGTLDIDTDGQADLRCAVDSSGNIISLIFTTPQWGALQIDAPIGVESAPPTEKEQEEQAAPPADTDEDTDEDDPKEPPAGDDTGSTDVNVPPRPDVELLPVEEDRYLWAFVYATAREAWVFDQLELFSAFRQLELTYEDRYRYPFTTLLPTQPVEPEALPEISYTPLTPTPLTTGEYLLSIYDLPSGERLVLYLSPTSYQCMGFALLRY